MGGVGATKKLMYNFARFSVTEGNLKSGSVQQLARLLMSENEWEPGAGVGGRRKEAIPLKLHIFKRREGEMPT